MLKIRDIREEDREIFFEMAKDFYGGPACDLSLIHISEPTRPY